MTEHQTGIIMRHAGVMNGKAIAKLAGVPYGTLRNWCSQHGISLGMVFERDESEDALVEWLYGWCTMKQVAMVMDWKPGKVRGRLLQLGITKRYYK